MEYYEIAEDFPIVAGPPRSPGLHVSDIYGDIMHTVFNEPEYDSSDLWAHGGFVWEELLSIAFKYYCLKDPRIANSRVIFRPGEVDLDGVIMSPDGIEVTAEDVILEEYKFTWRSAKKHPVEVWKWTVQVQAYLKALKLNKCRMRVFYVNGFYDFEKKYSDHPFKPHYRVCMLEYSDAELEENWSMLKKHAQMRGWL